MNQERYAAEYVASLDDMPTGEHFDPADVKYTTRYGWDLDALIESVANVALDGEMYSLRREEYREICPGDGVYDWESVSSIDQFTKHETWAD